MHQTGETMETILAALFGAIAGFGGAIGVEIYRDTLRRRDDLTLLAGELEALLTIITTLVAEVGEVNRPPHGKPFMGQTIVAQLDAFVRAGILTDRRWLRAVTNDDDRSKILAFHNAAVATNAALHQHLAMPYKQWLDMMNMDAMRAHLLGQLWQEVVALKGSCTQARAAVARSRAELPVT
jgi:hypothetical protein